MRGVLKVDEQTALGARLARGATLEVAGVVDGRVGRERLALVDVSEGPVVEARSAQDLQAGGRIGLVNLAVAGRGDLGV